MKVLRNIKRLELVGDDGDTLTVHYDNRGEPYREGITLDLHNEMLQKGIGVFLTNREALELRDHLNAMYPSA